MAIQRSRGAEHARALSHGCPARQDREPEVLIREQVPVGFAVCWFAAREGRAARSERVPRGVETGASEGVPVEANSGRFRTCEWADGGERRRPGGVAVCASERWARREPVLPVGREWTCEMRGGERRRNGCPWDWRTCWGAVGARERGPWDKYTWDEATWRCCSVRVCTCPWDHGGVLDRATSRCCAWASRRVERALPRQPPHRAQCPWDAEGSAGRRRRVAVASGELTCSRWMCFSGRCSRGTELPVEGDVEAGVAR